MEAAPRVTAGADRDRFLDTLAGLVRRLKPAARVLEWPDGDSLCDPVWAERPDLEVVFVSDRAGSAGRLASQHPHWTVLSHATPGAIVGSGFRLMVIGSERFRREHADRRFQMADWLARTGVILIPAFARTAETSFRRVRMMTPGPIARQRNFGWRVRPLSESCGWLLRPERIPAPPTRSASLRRSRRPSARRAA